MTGSFNLFYFSLYRNSKEQDMNPFSSRLEWEGRIHIGVQKHPLCERALNL